MSGTETYSFRLGRLLDFYFLHLYKISSFTFTGVSNCYVFKSRLQEYAQKEGLTTPVYETLKEGPSHEPCFRSSVIVNNIKYDSLPGFFNRKAAEQSAAEVALLEIAKVDNKNDSIRNPVVSSFHIYSLFLIALTEKLN